MPTISMRQDEARIVYLGIVYHLARPGSELDPETKQEVAHGLRETEAWLRPQLSLAAATLELTDDQLARLKSGLLGAINELKTYPLLEAQSGRRSVAAGFDEALRELFPDVAADPDEAPSLAEDVLMLHRRLSQLTPAPPAEETAAPLPPRRWWKFWAR